MQIFFPSAAHHNVQQSISFYSYVVMVFNGVFRGGPRCDGPPLWTDH